MRSDCASSRSIPPHVAEQLLRAKQHKPRRSIYRLIRMMERAKLVQPGELSKSSVHRLLAQAGVSKRPARSGTRERRSFLPEHAGDVWMGDAMHGPEVIAPGGKVRKSYMLTQLDAATRYVTHSYFALSEGAAAQEHGFKQAVLKYGPPRVYYVDLGSAYIAHSLRVGCAEIGTRLLHAGVRDCEAKGAIERYHRTWREEVGDELPDRPLPLGGTQRNSLGLAWHRVPPTRARYDQAKTPRALPRASRLVATACAGHRSRHRISAPRAANGTQGRHGAFHG